MTSVKKLYDAINDRREITLHRFLFGLGIRHVGEVNAKRFARAYLSYAAFEKLLWRLYRRKKATAPIRVTNPGRN